VKTDAQGQGVLSDAELIAILIGSGSRWISGGFEQRILASVDNIWMHWEMYHCHNSFNLKE
jgi:DNA repair protein RadC